MLDLSVIYDPVCSVALGRELYMGRLYGFYSLCLFHFVVMFTVLDV